MIAMPFESLVRVSKMSGKISNEMHHAEGCCLIFNLLINDGWLELSTFGFG